MEPLIFWGSPRWAVEYLEWIKTHWGLGFIRAVITQPDKPAQRGQKLHPTPVKLWAQEHQIPVLTPTQLKDETFQENLKKLSPYWGLVFAYGKIIPPHILNLFPRGLINIHPSLLPKWRGANPIGRCLQAGEKETGVTLQIINPQLDAGDILAQKAFEIDPNDSCQEVFQKAFQISCQLLMNVLPSYWNQQLQAYPQDPTQVTYAPKFHNHEARISWHLTAWQVHNHIRAFGCWDGAFTVLGHKRVKIWKSFWISHGEPTTLTKGQIGEIVWESDKLWVFCIDGPLQLEVLQTEGQPKLRADDWYRSNGKLIQQHRQFQIS